MRTWKQRGGALVFGAVLAGLVMGADASVATAAAAAPATTTTAAAAGPAGIVTRPVAVITMVRIRDLMSAADRQLYRQQIRDARDAAARQRVHGQWMERLQARAAEHGVVMIVEARTPAPERRLVETARPVGPTAAPAPVVAPPPPRAP
jgi:hypothetical protein